MENKGKNMLEEKLLAEQSNDWIILVGLMLVSGCFSDFGSSKKLEELEKRIVKLETKNEIVEKILF